MAKRREIGQGRWRVALATVMMLAALGGCSTRSTKPSATYDEINETLLRAAADRKTAEADVGKALMPPLQNEPLAAAQGEQRFDLSVVNAPASQVFMALVNGTRYSMLLPPDLSGSVTVSLKDVTLKEALDTLRELYGYEYKVQGTRIFVQPNTLQSRVFQINYLASRRQGSSDLRVTSSSISGSGAGTTGTTGTTGGTTGAAAPATGATGAAGSSSDTSRVSMRTDHDFWSDLTRALTTIVGSAEGRGVVINPLSGVVLVRGFPADLRSVDSYLKTTQLVVDRQVMLEAKIIEVALADEYQSGVNWGAFKTSGNTRSAVGVAAPGTTLSTLGASATTSNILRDPATGAIVPFGTDPTSVITSQGFSGTMGNAAGDAILPGALGAIAAAGTGKGLIGLAFQTSNFAALLSFLETQGSVSVLSSPRIATINNQKAVLKVGTDELFITNVTSTTTTTAAGSTASPTVELRPYFSGISLDVTPQIDEDNNIILHVHPAVSTVSEKEKIIDLGSLGLYKLPLATSSINETDSIVRAQDGNIVAIGGLMRYEQSNSRSGLPGAGDFFLFGQRSTAMRKRELVILIKPTVIQNDRVWREDLIETQGRFRALDPKQLQPTPSGKQ